MIERLCLGTAKLGMPWYGLGSRSRPTTAEAGCILERAYQLGIRWYDCGAAYGDAEDLLLAHRRLGMRLVTKLSPYLVSAGRRRPAWDHVLLHNPTVLQDGWTFGASVYRPDEAQAALTAGVEALQVPYCVLDQRHVGILRQAKTQGVRTFARQPFLQGLLTQGWTARAAINHPGLYVRTLWPLHRFWRLCWEYRVSPLEAALRFALDSPADYVVFGVGSVAHLEAVVGVAGRAPTRDWPACGQALRRAFRRASIEIGSLWQ